MAERKRINGPGGADYVGIARNLLAQLKQSMKLNNLKVLQRGIDLPGGVRVLVSSVFGDDTITIQAPPDIEAAIAEAVAFESAVQMQRPEQLREPLIVVTVQLEDFVLTSDSANVSFDTASTLSTPPPRVWVAGVTGSQAAYSTPSLGYGLIPVRSGFERNPTIVAISSDGAWYAGSIDTFNSNISVLTQQAYGWVRKGCIWKGPNNYATVFGDSQPQYTGAVTGFISSRLVCIKRTNIDPKLSHVYTSWDGTGTGLVNSPYTGSVPSATGKTALGGRVVLGTNAYTYDGKLVSWTNVQSSGTCLVAIQDPTTGKPASSVTRAFG